MDGPQSDIKHGVSMAENVDVNRGDTSSVSFQGACGTVKLLDHGTVILIPTPSPDPKGRSSGWHVFNEY